MDETNNLASHLERLNQPTNAVFEAAMQEHIIAQAELIGTCQK